MKLPSEKVSVLGESCCSLNCCHHFEFEMQTRESWGHLFSLSSSCEAEIWVYQIWTNMHFSEFPSEHHGFIRSLWNLRQPLLLRVSEVSIAFAGLSKRFSRDLKLTSTLSFSKSPPKRRPRLPGPSPRPHSLSRLGSSPELWTEVTLKNLVDMKVLDLTVD